MDHTVQSCGRFLELEKQEEVRNDFAKRFKRCERTPYFYGLMCRLGHRWFVSYHTLNLLVRNLFRSAFFLFFRKESLSSDRFPFPFIVYVACSKGDCLLVDISNATLVDLLFRRAI